MDEGQRVSLAQHVQRLSQEAAELTEKADAKWRLRDSLLEDLLSRGQVPDPFIPNLYHCNAESFITSEPPNLSPAEHALVATINNNAEIFNKQLHERQDNPHGSGVTAQDIREQELADEQLEAKPLPRPFCAGCGEPVPHSGECCPPGLDL